MEAMSSDEGKKCGQGKDGRSDPVFEGNRHGNTGHSGGMGTGHAAVSHHPGQVDGLIQNGIYDRLDDLGGEPAHSTRYDGAVG